ncbi:cysteine desulfurase family protein [Leptotrichia sp. oral taxon 221]|uniref:cysteine desulfurase family protein n=1 Tax=Leptotrichia sp. oral taxon 221 TaxID=712362 RepID=UPI001B8BBEC1|nr:cysteine desulfurase family protein [Leptotrichia sp. oral taxon 221]QUB97675.1 cysteine desulfurase [Leptotrichia sp. oral taxon 221]
MIYLDNAASTKPKQEVIDVMVESMKENFANADAIHEFSHKIAQKIKKSRKIVGDFLGVDGNRVFFTAGGGDGNNLLLQGIIEANSRTKKHLITTKIEHPTVFENFRYYEQKGFEVDYLDVDKEGYVNTEQLKNLLREDTLIVSIGAVNSETGAIQNLEEIGKIIKEKSKDIYFHTDFVQGLGTVDIKFDEISVDAITMSGHKIYAPKGIGAIYLKKDVKVINVVKGENSENGIVKRTMPTELIFAFTKAVELLQKNYKNDMKKIQELKEKFAEEIEKNIENVKFNSGFDIKKSSPKILNVSFKGAKGEVLTHFLGMNEIYVSTGSACSSKTGNSRILEAMKLDPSEINGAIRFSFSIYNTLEEISEVVTVLKSSVERIRKMR